MVRPLFLWGNMDTSESTEQDPIEAVVSNPQHKYCTSCGIRKDLESFHRDETKEGGRRDTCKDCRSKINEQKKQDRLDAKLRQIEEEGLETLGGLSSGGSFDPHINEVFEAMMKPFGGVNGWAKHLFATYLACDPGSQKRVKIHDMMMQLAGKVTKLGLAERQLDMMEERDLLQVMRQHLVEYQKGNELPPTAIPTLDGDVIDADAVEVKDD
jgi:hypothetical protein